MSDIEIRTSVEPSVGALRSLHGVILATVCGLTAEMVLSSAFPQSTVFGAVGRVAVVFLILYTIHRFALESLSEYKPNAKDLFTLTSTIVASIGVVWLGRILSIGLATYSETSVVFGPISASSLFFAIPYSA